MSCVSRHIHVQYTKNQEHFIIRMFEEKSRCFCMSQDHGKMAYGMCSYPGFAHPLRRVLKVIPIGIPTYAGMKTGFWGWSWRGNRFSCLRRSECRWELYLKTNLRPTTVKSFLRINFQTLSLARWLVQYRTWLFLSTIRENSRSWRLVDRMDLFFVRLVCVCLNC